ncbi:MAG: hypothetical protein ACRDWE_13640, partial [Acidimicrobiales bacterium]
MATRIAGDPAGETEPPRLLPRPAEARPLPPPVRDADALVAVHKRWTRISGAPAEAAAPADAGDAGDG